MRWFSIAVALLVAFAIIGVGLMYLFSPRTMSKSFGLPLPEEGSNISWWLRLKGSRDVVSGLVLLASLVWGDRHMLGIMLLILALIPIGDMTLVLAARGSRATAACTAPRRPL